VVTRKEAYPSRVGVVSGADNLTALKYIVMKFNNTRAGLIY
jgi:hypothetical protein